MDIRKLPIQIGNRADIKNPEEDESPGERLIKKTIGGRSQKRSGKETKGNFSGLPKNKSEVASLEDELISFNYVSSNDLQEPLRKIQTFSSRILEKEYNNLSENGKEYFDRMRKAANRMQRIINDLVIFSNLNTGTQKAEMTELGTIISEVKEELKKKVEEKKASIRIGTLGKLKIIRSQFRNLVYNLLSNSLKFADKERPLRISITSHVVNGNRLENGEIDPEKKYVNIRFKDNGIGFEPRFCDRIFEVFQRLHSQDDYEGTGIGLAICKKIVENHNGIIKAHSELNKGATFDIYLPIEDQV